MIDELLAANAAFVASSPKLPDTPRPVRHIAVVTCMDARIDPLPVLGLELGDAKVLRNAGGRTSDEVLAGLALVVDRLGVDKVIVMHHTGCAAGTRPEDLTADLEKVRTFPGLKDVELAGFIYDVETGKIQPGK